jgi:hypothetical protein
MSRQSIYPRPEVIDYSAQCLALEVQRWKFRLFDQKASPLESFESTVDNG